MSEDHFLVLLAVAVLAAFTIYQSIDHHIAMKRERKINRELLDRLMARDYPSYAAGVAAIMRAENERPSLLGLKKKPDDPETMDLDDGLGMPVT